MIHAVRNASGIRKEALEKKKEIEVDLNKGVTHKHVTAHGNKCLQGRLCCFACVKKRKNKSAVMELDDPENILVQLSLKTLHRLISLPLSSQKKMEEEMKIENVESEYILFTIDIERAGKCDWLFNRRDGIGNLISQPFLNCPQSAAKNITLFPQDSRVASPSIDTSEKKNLLDPEPRKIMMNVTDTIKTTKT
uniref:Uncharacterized protein n=1 Tax=Timema monikensis TaxID=170555 RepID=A0A7R9EAH7_9NEOP|nr:unnamed protein product [Timema monikensis]